MKTNRDDTKNIEAKRLEQIRYIMEHWDELPEGLQHRELQHRRLEHRRMQHRRMQHRALQHRESQRRRLQHRGLEQIFFQCGMLQYRRAEDHAV